VHAEPAEILAGPGAVDDGWAGCREEDEEAYAYCDGKAALPTVMRLVLSSDLLDTGASNGSKILMGMVVVKVGNMIEPCC
jgi:hypothetical protein